MCEGERCGFLAAGKHLQEVGERLGLRIHEPERARGWRGRTRVGKPKADLAIDQLDHGGLASVDGVCSWVPQLGDQWPVLVASRYVSTLVEGPQRLRKEA